MIGLPHLTSQPFKNINLSTCPQFYWAQNPELSMPNSDVKILPSPSSSSPSAVSACSSANSPKWECAKTPRDVPVQSSSREPDRQENGEKIKRPMNAFMVWSQVRRAQIANMDGKMHNSQISKELGLEWRNMTAEQKAPYVKRAKDLRDELMRQHPDYVYRPKRKSRHRPKSANSLSIVPPTGVPNYVKTSEPEKIQANVISPSVAQLLLAAAQNHQSSLLLAAYQAQLSGTAQSLVKPVEVHQQATPISRTAPIQAPVVPLKRTCVGPALPAGFLPYTGIQQQQQQQQQPVLFDRNANLAATLASLNAQLNPLLLSQLSAPFPFVGSLSSSH